MPYALSPKVQRLMMNKVTFQGTPTVAIFYHLFLNFYNLAISLFQMKLY